MNVGVTDRNEETRSAICPQKCIRKQLEPCVVAIHDELSLVLVLDLRKPCILVREGGRGIGFGKVQDYIEEGRYGAGGDGLHPRHGYGG